MDKITVFWTREDFDISTDIGFLPLPDGSYLTRVPGGATTEVGADLVGMPEDMSRVLRAMQDRYDYLLRTPEGAHA
jgi:putative selenate reductase